MLLSLLPTWVRSHLRWNEISPGWDESILIQTICFYEVKYSILLRSHSGEKSHLGGMIFPNSFFLNSTNPCCYFLLTIYRCRKGNPPLILILIFSVVSKTLFIFRKCFSKCLFFRKLSRRLNRYFQIFNKMILSN